MAQGKEWVNCGAEHEHALQATISSCISSHKNLKIKTPMDSCSLAGKLNPQEISRPDIEHTNHQNS